MDFAYSEEQQDIQKLAQQILGDMSTVERLKELEAGRAAYDHELWQALAEAGLLGVALEEAVGGMDFGFESLCLLAEEVGRTVAKVPVLPVLVGAAMPLQRFGTAQQKEQWLPGIASGESLVVAARVEPGNDDPLQPTLQASELGAGYKLNGYKHCVPLVDQARAVIVAARCGGELVIAAVEPQTDGVAVTPQQVTTGDTVYQLHFRDVDISPEHILAIGADAEQWLSWTEQCYQAASAATAVGLCDRMMRMTASYTTEREQFGRAIATFQAVSHRMADCFIDIECLRLVTQQAVSLLNNDRDAQEAVTIAKIWCGDVCHRVSQAAQHCHGGIGVDRDYPLFRYCLTARQIELTAGSSARLLGELGQEIAREALA